MSEKPTSTLPGEPKIKSPTDPHIDLTEAMDRLRSGEEVNIFGLYAAEITDDEAYDDYVTACIARKSKKILDRDVFKRDDRLKASRIRKKSLARLREDIVWYIGEAHSIEDYEKRVTSSFLIGDNLADSVEGTRYEAGYADYNKFQGGSFYKLLIDATIKLADNPEFNPIELGEKYLALVDGNSSGSNGASLTPWGARQRARYVGPINIYIYELLGFIRFPQASDASGFKSYKAGSWQEHIQSNPLTQNNNACIFLASILDAEQLGASSRRYETELLDIPHIAPTSANLGTYTQIEEDLSTVNRQELPDGITKIIRVGIETFENVISQIVDDQPVSSRDSDQKTSFAEAVKRKLEEAKNDSILSFTDLIELANVVTPPVKALSGENNLEDLDPKDIKHLSAALDRVAYFVINDPNRPMMDDDTEQVWQAAFRCSSLLVEIGTDRKVEQRVITLGDLAIKLSMGEKLTKQEIKALSGGVRRSRQQSLAEAVYGALKARRRSARYGLHESGRGLLS